MTATTSTTGFRWLDLLEKEFDKSYVDLEHTSRSMADEYDLDEVYDQQRKLLTNLGNCFVQLVHKAQTIFQINAKLEAENLHLKTELQESQKSLTKVDTEKRYLLCCLQSSMLETHVMKTGGASVSREAMEKLSDKVQLKLANEMASFQRIDWDSRRVQDQVSELSEENFQLRKERAELESELVGARLDAKYLDKELAGRIQQIQILLASNASQEHKQQVWAQIESEMHLQRSKTIANMCYSKQRLREQQQQQALKAVNSKTNIGSDEVDSGGAGGQNSTPNGQPNQLSDPENSQRVKTGVKQVRLGFVLPIRK